MKIDLYTKAVLTTIALALLAITGQNLLSTARAQQDAAATRQCGTAAIPCYVQNTPSNPIYVEIKK